LDLNNQILYLVQTVKTEVKVYMDKKVYEKIKSDLKPVFGELKKIKK